LTFDIYLFSIPFIKPFGLSAGIQQVREGFIISLDKKYAEVSPLLGYSKETLKDVFNQLTNLPTNCDINNLYPSVEWGLLSLLLPKIDNKLSLCHLNYENSVKCAKIKLFDQDIEKCIHKCKSIKEKDSSVVLRLDINRAWSLNDAKRFSNAFSVRDFEYLEEPCRSIEDLIMFSKATNFPIGLDETLYLDNQIPKLPSVKALILKPTLLGNKLIHFIQKGKNLGLELVFSSSFETSIGIDHIWSIANIVNGSDYQGLDTLKYLKYESPFNLDLKKDIINQEKETFCKKIFSCKNTKNIYARLEKLERFMEANLQLSTKK